MYSSASTEHKILPPRFFQKLLRPVNNSALIAFRIIFGFLLFFHCVTALLSGTIYKNFIQPPFTFTFIGFEWLQPLPGNGMYFFVAAMALFALLIMLGAWYRLSMLCFAISWTAMYLMQKSGYNNHYYLLLLLCWIMVFLPVNRYCSIDVKRKVVAEATTCGRYCILIFIAQIAIVYFYAAISKLTSDWFSGKYIAIQFSGLSSRRLVGVIYGQRWFQLLICYGGFLFDLLIVPLLLWKRTRNFAFIFSCLFHLFNSYTFSIGIFPYLSIALNLFFIDPAVVSRLFFKQKNQVRENTVIGTNKIRRQKLLVCCFGIYLFFQFIIPIRPWLFPGNVFWSEEGYRMSWKMMLRTKSGKIFFKITDPVSHKEWKNEPAKIFAPPHVMWLAVLPDITWQYAQRLKKEFAEKGYPNVNVYAIGSVSLNRGKPQPLVDSTVDLASVNWERFRHSRWINELKQE